VTEKQVSTLKQALSLARSVWYDLQEDYPDEWTTLFVAVDEALLKLINHPENAYDTDGAGREA
jgi:hypothetical protein